MAPTASWTSPRAAIVYIDIDVNTPSAFPSGGQGGDTHQLFPNVAEGLGGAFLKWTIGLQAEGLGE